MVDTLLVALASRTVDILGPLSVLLAIIAIVQTYRAHKFACRVAEVEGVFEKPGVSISLFNDPMIERIIWAIPFPGDGFVEVPLVYNIANKRKKSSIKNIELIIRMTKDLHGGDLADYDLEAVDSLKDIKSKFVDVTKYVHKFLMSIDSLSPNQTMDYEDKFIFREGTTKEWSTIAKDKNDIEFKIQGEVDLAYAIDLILMAEDIEPIRRHFSHEVIDTSRISLEDYFRTRTEHIQENTGYNKMHLIKRIYCFKKHLTKKNINFILFCCKSSNLEKVGDDPLYKVTKFHMTYGTKFINGYAIPAEGIYPRPIKKIFGLEFFVPWL